PGTGAKVGLVRDLTFSVGSLWVVSGDPAHAGGFRQALRRVDPITWQQVLIPVGSDPVAVAAGGGSIWVANTSDGTIERVDPAHNQVIKRISVGARPTALAFDPEGVWVAVA